MKIYLGNEVSADIRPDCSVVLTGPPQSENESLIELDVQAVIDLIKSIREIRIQQKKEEL